MGKVNLNSGEFGDFTITFLLDKILHPEEVAPYNEEFDVIIDNMKSKGMKSLFLKYYLDMDPEMRIWYKRIKPSLLAGANNNSTINIMPLLNDEPEKEGIIKRTIKKLLKKENITRKEENLLLEYINEEE